MDHELAVKNQAVERYFLGEMEPAEREEFEEHFFVCESCADDVRATSTFVDNAKAILAEPQARPKAARGRNWTAWLRPAFLSTAVAAACLAVMAYQNFSVIPGLRAPQSITKAYSLDGVTRSSSAGPKVPAGAPLRFEMPWDGAAAGNVYVELRSGSKTVSSGSIAVPAAHDPLDVYFPGHVSPGRYNVVVRSFDNGQPGRELMNNEFEVIP